MLKQVPVIFFALLVCWAGNVGAEALTIGRMRVAVWPEYDDPGVLVVYDGRFKDSRAFPTRSRFFLPKGVVISDACSLSPEGQHFCQLFELEAKEHWDEIELWLPFANFYLSFHLPSLSYSDDRRAFTYKVRTNHPVERLELDFQQPLRSTGFSIDPPGGVSSTRNGFTHFLYTFNELSPGEEKVSTLVYQKSDLKPSMDIKFSAMTGDKVFGSPYDVQRKVGLFVYLLFGSGVVILMSIVGWWFWKRKRAIS